MRKPWQFQPGQSANPKGRPLGSRNKASVILDQIAEGQAAKLLRGVMRRAHDGDLAAAALILSRVWPARKARIKFRMPPIARAADLPAALSAITIAVSEGILSTAEAADLAQLMTATARAYELLDLAERVERLEKARAVPE